MSPQPTPETDDPVLTTRAAARLLGVAVSTAQLWIENGALDAWKTPGGHRRVRLSAVHKLIERRAAAPAVPADPEFLPAPAPSYPVANGEAARLAALWATGLVDSPGEEVFDRVTRLAARLTGCPMAVVSLLTSTRQWFKSRVGVAAIETPREWAFCSHAILGDEPFVVEDARADARFEHNPLVTGEPHIVFYGGFPLHDASGARLGTLCVFDRKPRRLADGELRALGELAAIAADEIKRRSKA